MEQRTVIDGRYTLSDLVGAGGMARVFLARDGVLERDVALKILRDQYAENEEFVERFRREALSISRLSHPNIVQIFDRGETENSHYYIAMEYVAGGTLKDRIIREGPLELRKAAEVAAQVASALRIAHENGIIHRDIKPQNILVSESGDVKVADFGIAYAATATAISDASNILGTVRYMAPEQVIGEPVTPASDLYSLGVVLYEMLTGQVPFEAETPVAIFTKHIHEPPQPPDEADPGIPASMSALVLKLLAKNPEDRYPNAGMLISDLWRVIDGEDSLALKNGAVPPATPGRTGTRRRKKLMLATATLASVGLLGTLGWGAFGDPGGGGGDIVGTLKNAPGGALGAVENAGQTALSTQTEVPDVEGMTSVAATERLAEANLGAALRYRESTGEETGLVTEQSVPGGEKVERGSRVLLAVGDGPREEPPPGPPPSEQQPAGEAPAGGASGDAAPGDSYDAGEGTSVPDTTDEGVSSGSGSDDATYDGGGTFGGDAEAETPEPDPNTVPYAEETRVEEEPPAAAEELPLEEAEPPAEEIEAPTEVEVEVPIEEIEAPIIEQPPSTGESEAPPVEPGGAAADDQYEE